jgi:putative membrane protein
MMALTTTVIGQEPSARPARGSQAQNPRALMRVFMRTAAMDGLAQMEHGRLATENGSAAEVTQFGQRMVDDH